MWDLKTIAAAMDTKHKAMQQCLEDEDEAIKAGNKDAAKTARDIYEEEAKAYKGLVAKSEEALKAKEREAYRLKILKASESEATEDDQASAEGKGQRPGEFDPNGMKVPLEAKDHVRKEREHGDAFFQYLNDCGHRVTPAAKTMQILDANRVDHKCWGKAMGSVKLPRSLADRILPKAISSAEGPPVLSSQTSPGFIQDNDFRPDVVQYKPEPTFLFDRTTKTTTTDGVVEWPRLEYDDPDVDPNGEYGGVDFQWIGEGAQKQDTEPRFEQVLISAHEAAARTELSRTVLRRSRIDLENFIVRLYRRRVGSEIDNVIIGGDGTNKPLGVDADSDVRTVLRTTADDLKRQDLINLKYALNHHHRANSMYVIADGGAKKLEEELDDDGRPLFTDGVTVGLPTHLSGLPWRTTHRMTLGGNDVILGDWSEYVTVMENDLTIETSMHEKFSQNRIVMIAWMLIGGRAITPKSFVRLSGTVAS